MINCVHLPDYEIETAGDVPLTINLFVSAYRNAAGTWSIEQIRIREIATWFDAKQGCEIELIRGEFQHVFPIRDAERFVLRFLVRPEQAAKLSAALDIAEEAGVFHAIA